MNTIDFGIIGYNKALRIQEEMLEKRISGQIDDTLLVLEHEAVVTLGRIMSEDELIDRAYYEKKNIPILKTGRGGRATYHAPGQLVLYPILKLEGQAKNISAYIDLLERAAENALRALGVEAERDAKKRGVWASGKKIAFTGIAIKKWVTYHGVSVNINNHYCTFPFLRIILQKFRAFSIRIVSAGSARTSLTIAASLFNASSFLLDCNCLRVSVSRQ